MLEEKYKRVNSIDREVLFEKRPMIQEDSDTLVFTFNPALFIILDILKSAHRIIENFPERTVTFEIS